MKKSILNLGQALNKAEQKSIAGGGINFIGSSCYTSMSRCNSAMAAAISHGADPAQTRCEPCILHWGASGFEVRIYGTLF
ncbi:hypothetical protein [uncultured Tenacibaculum sp.]|uniref:hypothetical protein n=1 Tax=uncultured Tenacibaculum sp. TaxID=174713 RepID=UPI0026380052|nr:hypothetical protein [uncultured Tenacibaculum sp.]